MRVHELAKEYGIKSTEFVDTIQSFGYDIKSHLSTLDGAQVADIRYKIRLIDEEKEAAANQNVYKVPEGSSTRKALDKVLGTTPELKPTSPLNKEVLEPVKEEEIEEKTTEKFKGQAVIVEKPTGFWGWLKSLFS